MTDYLFSVLEFPSDLQGLLSRSEFFKALPILLFLVAVWLLLPILRRSRAERRIRASVSGLGTTALCDVSLDNGMDGFVFIDHLVLTPKEVLVITLMNSRGIVFGGEKVESWALVEGRRTLKFPNPLIANQERVLAVKYHAPEVDVRGMVLFNEACSFPKGRPEGVQLQNELSSDAAQRESPVPEKLQTAWEKLTNLALEGAETYGRDVLVLRGKQTHTRETVAAFLLVAGFSLVTWQALA